MPKGIKGFQKGNTLASDINKSSIDGIRSTKQKEKEALETNKSRIKEYMDDLWAELKDKDKTRTQRKEAGKQWKDAMKYLAPLVEDKAQIDITDSQLTDIAKRIQTIYKALQSKSEGLN